MQSCILTAFWISFNWPGFPWLKRRSGVIIPIFRASPIYFFWYRNWSAPFRKSRRKGDICGDFARLVFSRDRESDTGSLADSGSVSLSCDTFCDNISETTNEDNIFSDVPTLSFTCPSPENNEVSVVKTDQGWTKEVEEGGTNFMYFERWKPDFQKRNYILT